MEVALWRSAPALCLSCCSGTHPGCDYSVFISGGTRFTRTPGYRAETPSASIARVGQPKVTQVTAILLPTFFPDSNIFIFTFFANLTFQIRGGGPNVILHPQLNNTSSNSLQLKEYQYFCKLMGSIFLNDQSLLNLNNQTSQLPHLQAISYQINLIISSIHK